MSWGSPSFRVILGEGKSEGESPLTFLPRTRLRGQPPQEPPYSYTLKALGPKGVCVIFLHDVQKNDAHPQSDSNSL